MGSDWFSIEDVSMGERGGGKREESGWQMRFTSPVETHR